MIFQYNTPFLDVIYYFVYPFLSHFLAFAITCWYSNMWNAIYFCKQLSNLLNTLNGRHKIKVELGYSVHNTSFCGYMMCVSEKYLSRNLQEYILSKLLWFVFTRIPQKIKDTAQKRRHTKESEKLGVGEVEAVNFYHFSA